MILRCPRDTTPLEDAGNRTYTCPECHWQYVVSITDAYTTRTGWNRDAPGAGAVLAVMAAEDDQRSHAA